MHSHLNFFVPLYQNSIIVTVGDLVIGVQCVNPLLFVLGGTDVTADGFRTVRVSD